MWRSRKLDSANEGKSIVRRVTTTQCANLRYALPSLNTQMNIHLQEQNRFVNEMFDKTTRLKRKLGL
jgi:hypothetical protein